MQTAKNTRYTFSDFKTIGEGGAKSVSYFLLRKSEVKKFEQEVKEKAFLFDQWAQRNK